MTTATFPAAIGNQKHLRRRSFIGLFGLAALAPPSTRGSLRNVIVAGDPGAENLQVVNEDTGAVLDLVYMVCQSEKWILRYASDGPGKLTLDRNGNPLLIMERGNWTVHPKA